MDTHQLPSSFARAAHRSPIIDATAASESAAKNVHTKQQQLLFYNAFAVLLVIILTVMGAVFGFMARSSLGDVEAPYLWSVAAPGISSANCVSRQPLLKTGLDNIPASDDVALKPSQAVVTPGSESSESTVPPDSSSKEITELENTITAARSSESERSSAFTAASGEFTNVYGVRYVKIKNFSYEKAGKPPLDFFSPPLDAFLSRNSKTVFSISLQNSNLPDCKNLPRGACWDSSKTRAALKTDLGLLFELPICEYGLNLRNCFHPMDKSTVFLVWMSPSAQKLEKKTASVFTLDSFEFYIDINSTPSPASDSSGKTAIFSLSGHQSIKYEVLCKEITAKSEYCQPCVFDQDRNLKNSCLHNGFIILNKQRDQKSALSGFPLHYALPKISKPLALPKSSFPTCSEGSQANSERLACRSQDSKLLLRGVDLPKCPENDPSAVWCLDASDNVVVNAPSKISTRGYSEKDQQNFDNMNQEMFDLRSLYSLPWCLPLDGFFERPCIDTSDYSTAGGSIVVMQGVREQVPVCATLNLGKKNSENLQRPRDCVLRDTLLKTKGAVDAENRHFPQSRDDKIGELLAPSNRIAFLVYKNDDPMVLAPQVLAQQTSEPLTKLQRNFLNLTDGLEYFPVRLLRECPWKSGDSIENPKISGSLVARCRMRVSGDFMPSCGRTPCPRCQSWGESDCFANGAFFFRRKNLVSPLIDSEYYESVSFENLVASWIWATKRDMKTVSLDEN